MKFYQPSAKQNYTKKEIVRQNSIDVWNSCETFRDYQ